MKTSRGDFLSELKHPIKRRIGMRYSNEFYFVTTAALVNVGEIPPECGLVEAGYATFAEWKGLIGRDAGFFNYDPQSRAYCMITVPAPWRDTPGPTWQLVAAMLRNQRRQFAEAPPRRPVQERQFKKHLWWLAPVRVRARRSSRFCPHRRLERVDVLSVHQFRTTHRGRDNFRIRGGVYLPDRLNSKRGVWIWQHKP